MKQPEEAMSSLLYIIDQPPGLFTEPALMAASRISFETGDYNLAAELFKKETRLGKNKANIAEAERGLMRAYSKLGEQSNTIEAAKIVLLQDKLEPAVKKEASYLIAKTYFVQNEVDLAYEWFEKIAGEVNTAYGAEAKYRLAEIDYQRDNKQKAESTVLQMIEMNTPHHYWMGKTFLLMSDIYLDKNDEFQAVQTLETIINYYPIEDDGIKEDALARKALISEKVNRENQESSPEMLEINIGGGQ
jgi:tetratricopeptide (TPR) repeat protein